MDQVFIVSRCMDGETENVISVHAYRKVAVTRACLEIMADHGLDKAPEPDHSGPDLVSWRIFDNYTWTVRAWEVEPD